MNKLILNSILLFSLLLFPEYVYSQEKESPGEKLGNAGETATGKSENNDNIKQVNSQPTSDSSPLQSKASVDGTPVKDASSLASKNKKSQEDDSAASTSEKPKEKIKIVVKKVEPAYKKVPVFRVHPRGPNAITAGIGIKAGLTDNSTGGFYINFGYNYQLSKVLWADSLLGVNFGGDCTNTGDDEDNYQCGGLNGFGLDLMVGVLYRFLDFPLWKIPVNPYIRLLTGVSFIVSNGPNDGFGLVMKGAGGARYSFNDEIAVGVEMGMTLGPAFRNVIGAGAFFGFDFVFNVEYSF
ncbi:MAG: hypothetical protein PF689_03675 [Deltaproteobacteria bacterium]|jgi:hypothetical protein|nr:hypothetical protein [Deltaproteobacteria bacterium]